MKNLKKSVRKSVALPAQLIEDAKALAPPDIKHNFNRLVATALKRFTEEQKKLTFEKQMAEMARDLPLKRVSEAISKEMAVTDSDGLIG